MRFLVTAGPTREAIDDIRYLSNASTGRMGYEIARAAAEAGHETVLLSGPVCLSPPQGVRTIKIVSARDLQDACSNEFPAADALVMTAAVADYRPETRTAGQRKRDSAPWSLSLVPNPDILAELGARKANRFLAGFALESDLNPAGVDNARRKLVRKNLDLIVLNAPATIGAADSDFVLLYRDGRIEHYMSRSKADLARRLVSAVAESRIP